MSGNTIGIFEDDARLLKMYGDVLRARGYRVFEARDAHVGLSILGKIRPDLVLLDVMMPNMNGFDACRRVREVLGNDVPVVFLTALDDVDSLRKAFEAGGNDFLSKSEPLEHVLESIAHWLAQRGKPQTAEAREAVMAKLEGFGDRTLARAY